MRLVDAPFSNETLQFRDPEKAAELVAAIARLCVGREADPICVMHVCGSHEQAIARFGLRHALPAGIEVIMGPGCPVCVTDSPEVDEAVLLAERGNHIVTYGDMLRVPGSAKSLADAKSEGARVGVVYSATQAVDLARRSRDEVVFFATGFETTAVATAAVLLQDPPKNFSVLSAHKYIPPVMEIVAEMPGNRVEGFLAAGHAATITGWGVFEHFVERQGIPVVVAGFEPLDIFAGLLQLLELIRSGQKRVANSFPRCVTREGNQRAQQQLWEVFELVGGRWRGIARVPNGNLRLKPGWAEFDARCRFEAQLARRRRAPVPQALSQCICGQIMAGTASPTNCSMFGRQCTPQEPVGACMVSAEGTCKIWHQYGGHPDLATSV
jgi:hydrogenase expression/formation protein HypD